MGEIADDMINGRCCSICGCFFIYKKNKIYEHGYPVVCEDCYFDGCGYEKSLKKTF